MKLLLTLATLVAVTYVCEAGVGDLLDQYDLLAMAKDEQQFQRVITCLALEVPCDNLKGLKENGTILLKSNCGDCTSAQKEKYDQFIAYMKKAHPKEFEQIMKFISEDGLKSDQ